MVVEDDEAVAEESVDEDDEEPNPNIVSMSFGV